MSDILIENESMISFVKRPFLDVISDGVRQAGLALVTTIPEDLRNAGAKASVLHSAFSIEAATNCVLATMNYSARLLETVDRLQPIEKLEFIASHFTDAPFDRGNTQVQSARELFRIRNEYVHPKIREDQLEYENGEVIIFEHERWSFLGFPKLSQLWDFEAALRCLKAVDDVLDYFFADLCELSPEESQMFLISAITEGTDTKLAVPVEHLEILKTAREKWKLQFRFLNLDNPVENVIDQKYKRKR